MAFFLIDIMEVFGVKEYLWFEWKGKEWVERKKRSKNSVDLESVKIQTQNVWFSHRTNGLISLFLKYGLL